MAEAFSSFKEQFDDQLTCGVCLDHYTDPKTLPCQHSFCLKCIQPLPVEIKDGKYYISCPTCRVDHPIPQGGAINLPNDFQINKMPDLRKNLTYAQKTTASSTTCPKHNDPLKVYCETCCQVICRDCTISEEHNTHNFYLIPECYPKHHQQIQDSLDLVKQTMADIGVAETRLATRERDVLQQGQQLKEQINTHAQQIIDHIQRSQTHLSQQVDTIVQQKTQLLSTQRQQAQRIYTQLKTCREKIEQSLKELNKQQILTEKHTMMDEMNTATQHVDPTVFQPIEKADMQFTKCKFLIKDIGSINSSTYKNATLTTNASLVNQPSTATLTLQSHDHGSPFSLPPSLISSTLSSLNNRGIVKCDITQTNQGKYDISFIPFTRGMHQLTVQIEAVDVPRNPSFSLCVSPLFSDCVPRVIGGLKLPAGIAVCDNGEIVVAERGTNSVSIVTGQGHKVTTFKTQSMVSPMAVAVSGISCFVTDQHRLQKLSTTNGSCIKSVGGKNTSGSGHLEFNCPSGITVHPHTKRVFVADCRNNRIQVFTNNLTFERTIASEQFKTPCHVSLDHAKDHLYIAEIDNHCVTKMSLAGHHLAKFGSEGSAPGQLLHPCSVTIYNDLVYISEWGNHRISVFDTDGKFIYCFGNKGNGVRQFHEPGDIVIDKMGNLYVSDTLNNRIVVY